MYRATRAKAKKWFKRRFPHIRIERIGRTTAYVSHHPNFVCMRYYTFKFVNAHHPDFDECNPEWD